MDSSGSANGAEWENEKVLTHSRTGWDIKTRREVVEEAGQREYDRTRASRNADANPIRKQEEPRRASSEGVITSCGGGVCWDIEGRRYNESRAGLQREDGKQCQRSANRVQCD